MWIFWGFLSLCFVCWASADQYQYRVIQDNVTIEDWNREVLDVNTNIYKFNDTTNAFNMSFILKMNIPESTKVFVTAFKWLNGEYRLGLIQFSKTVHSAIEMDMFDLQGLFVKYCRPPMIWPLEKGVRYRSAGWSPDSSKFPPNLPEGKWKVPITVAFANKTKIVVLNWYLRLVYDK